MWTISCDNSETYEKGCQFLLITNRKSHTGFRLVPTSMTLNDLERRNSPYFASFFTDFDSFQADYITVVEDVRKILSPSSSLSLLAKTITHPAARSLCDSWAFCNIYGDDSLLEAHFLWQYLVIVFLHLPPVDLFCRATSIFPIHRLNLPHYVCLVTILFIRISFLNINNSGHSTNENSSQHLNTELCARATFRPIIMFDDDAKHRLLCID